MRLGRNQERSVRIIHHRGAEFTEDFLLSFSASSVPPRAAGKFAQGMKTFVMSSTRVHRAVLAVACALVATAWAAERVVVEDWRSYPHGTRGIPRDWKEQTWGKPAYDLEIVSDDGQPALHLRSKGETSAIIRDLKASVDLKETPIIEWSWKVMTLPTGGNACHKSTDDEAAQVYVAWVRTPETVRSRIIGYVWDSTAPAGTICKSEKTSTVTYVVLRSGRRRTRQMDYRAPQCRRRLP